MKNKILSVVLLSGVMAFAVPAYLFAAPLGLTTGSPVLGVSLASIDYLEFGLDGDLSTFGAVVDSTDGLSTIGFTELGFGFGFSLSEPIVGATAGFDIYDEGGLVLSGDLIAVGFSTDLIELQFGSLVGAGAASFGSSVLASLMFSGSLGADPFASLIDGDFYSATITISNVVSISPVPLPAALPLFLSGLFSLGWLGRRRSTK